MADWCETRPLTIDKVGTYFRQLTKPSASSTATSCLIFDISLSGNATKIVEIKSPVSIKNTLSASMQCKIESSRPRSLSSPSVTRRPLIVDIARGQEMCVPISYLPCRLLLRPIEPPPLHDENACHDDENDNDSGGGGGGGGVVRAEFSSEALTCEHVRHPGQIEYFQMACRLTKKKKKTNDEIREQDETNEEKTGSDEKRGIFILLKSLNQRIQFNHLSFF